MQMPTRTTGPRTLTAVMGMAMMLAAAGCGTVGAHAGNPAQSTHSASSPASVHGATGSLSTPAPASPAPAGSTVTGAGHGTTASGQSQVAGIWPVRTRAQAIRLQHAADAGHQPWLLDPAQVVGAYLRSVWHVNQPDVQKISATRYVGRLAATSQTLLTVTQPVRIGSGGIWVIASATQQNAAGGGVDTAIKVYGNCTTPSVEPSEIVLACADNNALLTGLHWTSWTATSATAVGTLEYNDCNPYCAAGHFHDVPGTQVTLTAPVQAGNGLVVWSKVQESPEPPGYATGPYHGGPQPLTTRPLDRPGADSADGHDGAPPVGDTA